VKHSLLVRLIPVFILYPFVGLRAADSPEISGFVKNFTVLYDFPQGSPWLPSGGTALSNDSRFRLKVDWSAAPGVSFQLAYELAPQLRQKNLFAAPGTLLEAQRRSYRVADFDPVLFPTDGLPGSASVRQNLDRLQATIRFRFADLYIGRQAIAWGSARVVNPTDVLTPFAYTDLDVEDRTGVDAIRLRAPLGSLGELDAGYVFGHDFDYSLSAVFLRGKVNFWKTDLALMAVDFQENLLAGIDITRGIGGAGFYLEAGQVFAGLVGNGTRRPEDDYFRASLGTDYTLRNGTYLFLEYHFNECGSSRTQDYPRLWARTAYREGAVYLLGRHYLAGGLTRSVTPLVTVGIQSLVNLGDGSFFVVPNLEYNLVENLYLSAGSYLAVGRHPSESGPVDVSLQSEFGSYPFLLFTSLRFYF